MPAYSTMGIRRRIASLFLVTGLFTFFLASRLVYLQLIRSDYYLGRALDQRLYPIPVDAKRGAICDRNGRELAVSVSADSIYAVPAEIVDPAGTAGKLTKVLGMGVKEIQGRITEHSASVWIKRKVSENEAMAVKKLNLPGIGFTERGQRFYPRDTLAAHVLGIAGIDNQGLEGLEVEYDNYLRGIRGQIMAERDATGREIPEGIRRFWAPEDGNDLYLTIDETIQYIAERELDKGILESKAKGGVIIVMNPKTGEILAMASRPAFDPNSYADYPAEYRRNIALSDSYEPGSTFKIVTAAAALEEGVVTPTTRFFDPGFLVVEDRRIRCWLPGGHGSQTFVEATENSCNPVFASLGVKLGRDRFYKYIKAFGFGSRTGIDFPGEAEGIVMPLRDVGLVEAANISFGQGISVTPLQLINALSTIANGGTLMKPMLVRKIVDPKGDIVKEFKPTKIRQAISPKTARELTRILESVVVNGSGTRAQISGYSVAGKTGTAEKPEAGGYGEKRVASFLGFAPVDDPRLAALVVLDEPNCGITYGGVLAAPVFKSIVQDVLWYLEVPPTYPSKALPRGEEAEEMTMVPDVRNLTIEDASTVLDSSGLRTRVEGTGKLVRDQIPKPGARVAYGTTVILYFDQGRLYNEEELSVTVPNVVGMTLKDAALALGAAGLRMDAKGSGWVKLQDPAPGSKVRPGTIVAVECNPESKTGNKPEARL